MNKRAINLRVGNVLHNGYVVCKVENVRYIPDFPRYVLLTLRTPYPSIVHIEVLADARFEVAK